MSKDAHVRTQRNPRAPTENRVVSCASKLRTKGGKFENNSCQMPYIRVLYARTFSDGRTKIRSETAEQTLGACQTAPLVSHCWKMKSVQPLTACRQAHFRISVRKRTNIQLTGPLAHQKLLLLCKEHKQCRKTGRCTCHLRKICQNFLWNQKSRCTRKKTQSLVVELFLPLISSGAFVKWNSTFVLQRLENASHFRGKGELVCGLNFFTNAADAVR